MTTAVGTYTESISIRSGSLRLEGDLSVPDGASGLVVFAHGSGSSRHSPRNKFVARSLESYRVGTLLLDLLTRLARAVLLPSPVVQEIRRGPAVGPARRAVEAGWGTEVPVRYIRVAVRSLGLLGPGEQSVLTLGLRRPGSRVILDDRQARKGAERLGLPMTGTVGVILFAQRRGLIPAVVPLFQAIRAAGFRSPRRATRWERSRRR